MRPRILFLSQCLPYPPHSGVANRTYNILRQLHREFDIDLITFFRIGHQSDSSARAAARDALRNVATFVAEPTPIPSEHSTWRKIWDHFRGMVTRQAYTYYHYRSETFAQRLHEVLRARSPNLVHLDSLDFHGWVSELPRAPITCTHHDIDSELLRLRARHVDNRLLRGYLRFQAARIERLEREMCARFDLNLVMSRVDSQKLRARCPAAATLVIPNGTDTEYFQPNGTGSIAGRVAFVGPTYSSQPNRDAVEFLLQDVWPRIRAADKAATLRLIGRNSPQEAKRYGGEPGVEPLGYLPDMRPELARARCCIVPLRIGGGTRLKILDAWAMGKAVVSTSIGCEGLDAVDGENILIRDTPDDMARAVLEVLRDAKLRSHLERNGRRVAADSYSWNSVGETIRSAYRELLTH
jgi:glycosyltransferase involved in cell wall biosynthesis